MPVKPFRSRLLVVSEPEPQVLELVDFFAVLAVAQVDDMRNTQGLQLLYVPPGCNSAAKRQPLAYPKHPHAVAPFVRTQPVCKTCVYQTPFLAQLGQQNKPLTAPQPLGFYKRPLLAT